MFIKQNRPEPMKKNKDLPKLEEVEDENLMKRESDDAALCEPSTGTSVGGGITSFLPWREIYKGI